MTKNDIKIIVNELRADISYDVDDTPLHGCGLPDYRKKQYISKESIVMFLRWQCLMFNGKIDEEELSRCIYILQDKKVIMV